MPLEDVPFDAIGSGRLGFFRLDPDERSGLRSYYVIDAAAGVSSVHPMDGTSPSLSPSGTRIATSQLDVESIWDVFVWELGDTFGARLPGQTDDFDGSPVWKDEQTIVYSVRHVGMYSSSLRMRSASGEGPVTTVDSIPVGEIYGRASVVMEDAWLIAASSGSATGIFSVNPAGGVRRLLVESEEIPSAEPVSRVLRAPAWSPDGTRIAFLAEEAGEGFPAIRLYVLHVAEDSLALLASLPGSAAQWGAHRDELSVAWAPDGSRIAFTGYDAELQSHVYVIREDGTGLAQITSRPGAADFTVSWVP